MSGGNRSLLDTLHREFCKKALFYEYFETCIQSIAWMAREELKDILLKNKFTVEKSMAWSQI